MALRNYVDVAHVELGLFTPEQLKTIHQFSERAEHVFQAMLERVLTRVTAGEIEIAPYKTGLASKDAATIVERMRRALEDDSAT